MLTDMVWDASWPYRDVFTSPHTDLLLTHLHTYNTHTTQWWQFFRPDLDVAVVSRHSRFTVDLSEETLQAASTFHVLLAAGNDHTVASIGGGGIDAVRGGALTCSCLNHRCLPCHKHIHTHNNRGTACWRSRRWRAKST